MLRTDDSNSKLKDEWLLKNFCLDILSDQNQECSDECQFWSENVRCPTIISSTDIDIAIAIDWLLPYQHKDWFGVPI